MILKECSEHSREASDKVNAEPYRGCFLMPKAWMRAAFVFVLALLTVILAVCLTVKACNCAADSGDAVFKNFTWASTRDEVLEGELSDGSVLLAEDKELNSLTFLCDSTPGLEGAIRVIYWYEKEEPCNIQKIELDLSNCYSWNVKAYIEWLQKKYGEVPKEHGTDISLPYYSYTWESDGSTIIFEHTGGNDYVERLYISPKA